MKKHFILFEDDIDTDTIIKIVTEIHQYDNVCLYFATNGGYVTDMMFLIDVLNNHPKIEVILNSYLGSAGTRLLTKYKGKLKIAKTFEYFLFHKQGRKVYQLREQVINSKKLIGISEASNIKDGNKLLKLGIFNKKQYKNYMKGKDVVIFKKDIK